MRSWLQSDAADGIAERMALSNDRPPRVQFVSKPMVPPFRDGSKCLVRDLCLHLDQIEPHVMGTGEPTPELGGRTVCQAVYSGSGNYSPGFGQNLRAALFLLTKSRADIWHFVFAPNPRSSQVGGIVKKLRRVPTVQTIASPPRSFDSPGKLLFGDIAVAQSEWTRDQFATALAAARIERRVEVIFPPAPVIQAPSAERQQKERARLGLPPDAPVFLYPGDLEVSEGAAHVVAWAREITDRVPSAQIVVAYRDKTARVEEFAVALREHENAQFVTFERNTADIHALVATSTAILFPVDDLFGKVDLPIVLLEALRFGTPVLSLNRGPLASLRGALLLSGEANEFLDAIERVAKDPNFRSELVAKGYRALQEHFEPAQIARRYGALYEELLSRK